MFVDFQSSLHGPQYVKDVRLLLEHPRRDSAVVDTTEIQASYFSLCMCDHFSEIVKQ